MSKFIDAAAAAALIKDGDTVAISGNGAGMISAEAILPPSKNVSSIPATPAISRWFICSVWGIVTNWAPTVLLTKAWSGR